MPRLLSLPNLLAVHQGLLAAAVYAAVHTAWAGQNETQLALAAANTLLWLLVTRRRLPPGRPALTIGVAGWVLAAGALYMAAFGLYDALAYDAGPGRWLVEACVYGLTAVVAVEVFRSTGDARPYLAGLAVASVLVVAEGAWQLGARSTWQVLLTFQALGHGDASVFALVRLGGGSLPYYNTLASILVVFASASLALAACARTRAGRLLALGSAAVTAYGVVLTGSRAGTMFLFLLAVLHAAYHLRAWKGALVASSVTLAAAVLAVGLRPGGVLRGSGSLRARFHMWRVCFRVARDHPLLGGGPNAFGDAWASYGPAHGYAARWTAVDGLYADLLCVGGVPLLAAFLLVAGSVVWQAVSFARSQAAPAARLAVFGMAAGLGIVLGHDVVEASLKTRACYLLACALCAMLVAWRGRAQSEAAVEWDGSGYRSGGGVREHVGPTS